MGVATGCGCKEGYRFPHTTYPYSSCICSFLQHPYFLFIFKNVFLYICSALFRNLRFLQKALRFLGIPRKRSADMNVRTHTRWMRSNPSPSPGRRCRFYRGPLGQPNTVRTRTVSDARHASDTALPRAADKRRTLSDTDEYRPSSIRRVSGVRHCSGPHCAGLPCAACPMVRFLHAF